MTSDGVSHQLPSSLVAREFGEGEFAPIVVAVRTTGPATDPRNVAALYAWSRTLAEDPRISRVTSYVDVDPRLTLDQYQLLYGSPSGPPDRFVATALAATTRGDLTAFTITTPFGPNNEQGRALVGDLRDPSSPLAPPAGVAILVGGGAADVDDVVSRVWSDFPRTAVFIVITTFLVLFVLLRSVVLPVKALVMNTLSITASFGALVWIFQDGNLSALLGFQPLGFVETTQPVILFCVLFGLSMDYEVFLLSRMKEAWDRTGDNTEAVARGLDVDAFAPRLSFFFNCHNDFFEEIAKFRAARRIWAREMRETFGAQDPRSWALRFHTQTSGVSLTAQQPEVNLIRVAVQALAAVLGGTNSLHTDAMDEALAAQEMGDFAYDRSDPERGPAARHGARRGAARAVAAKPGGLLRYPAAGLRGTGQAARHPAVPSGPGPVHRHAIRRPAFPSRCRLAGPQQRYRPCHDPALRLRPQQGGQ